MTINEKLSFPSDPSNLSPAFASMVAQILTPNAWARVMRDAGESVGAKCKVTAKHIDK